MISRQPLLARRIHNCGCSLPGLTKSVVSRCRVTGESRWGIIYETTRLLKHCCCIFLFINELKFFLFFLCMNGTQVYLEHSLETLCLLLIVFAGNFLLFSSKLIFCAAILEKMLHVCFLFNGFICVSTWTIRRSQIGQLPQLCFSGELT